MTRNGVDVRRSRCLGAFGLVIGLLSALAPAVVTAPPVAAATRQPGPHIMPITRPGPSQGAPTTTAGKHLDYYGGRVMSNAKVVDVYWGSGSYETGAGPGQQMPPFFNAIGSSKYFDWLTEYNTTRAAVGGQPGTNQVIGHAGWAADVTITPSPANNGTTVDDTQMQAELRAQLDAGHLPAPQLDGQGNVNSLYGLFFPSGKTLTMGTTTGGVQWCAYHGTISYHGLSVPYMVLPNFNDPGYGSGCGADPTLFNDFTSVASHELVESVTDTEVGIATNGFAPPLAWYDQANNGEIGDLCNGQQGTIAGYVVQKQWSNTANACIVTADDFAISANPSAVAVGHGGTTTTTINTAVTLGSPETVALSVSGVPAGATAVFSPTSVASGGSSTLTIGGGTAAPGDYVLTVTGSAITGTHTTQVGVHLTPKVPTALFPSGLLASLLKPSAVLTRTDNGAPISGATVTFTGLVLPPCTAVTDATGTAKCTSLVIGLGYTASYAGDATFEPATAAGHL